jgi:hypothetical protein
MQSKFFGGLGQSFCVSYFLSQGFIVSQPLYDNARYDLIVDDGIQLKRVQCKYTTHYKGASTDSRAYPSVNLRTGKSRKQGEKYENYSPTDFDLLWVMTATSFYLIPSTEIYKSGLGKNELRLTPKWNAFLIPFPHPSGEPVTLEVEHLIAGHLTELRKSQIIELFQQGLSANKVGLQLGLSRSRISAYLSRRGIRRNG